MSNDNLTLLRNEKNKHAAIARGIVDLAKQENRGFTADEHRSFDAAVEEAKGYQESIDALDAIDIREEERENVARTLTPNANSNTRISVGSEPATYDERSGHSFFTDLVHERTDRGAAERLNRHYQETRAVDTGDLDDGIVTPAYLSDRVAHIKQAGLVLAELATDIPLPEKGMTVTIPKGTQASSVKSQTSENENIVSRDVHVEDLTFDVVTLAGMVDLSLQASERGVLVDELVMADLVRSHNAELEYQLFAGSGTNNQHKGLLNSLVLSVTCTSTEFRGQRTAILNAVNQVNNGHYDSPTAIVVSPRRWTYWLKFEDGQGRPLVNTDSAAFNPGAVGKVGASGPVGSVAGVPVYASPSTPMTVSGFSAVGGNEDIITVTRVEDLVIARNPVLRVAYDQPLSASLGRRLVARSYSAWTAERYSAATVIIHGTGLASPSFA